MLDAGMPHAMCELLIVLEQQSSQDQTWKLEKTIWHKLYSTPLNRLLFEYVEWQTAKYLNKPI